MGAALLFWGWQTGFLVAAVAMAAVIEARSLIDVRWDLSRSDFNRISDVSAVLLALIAVYHVLGNDSARAGTWLMVDAPGALRVLAEVGGRRIVRHRVHGGSFGSASDPRFHFGLGGAERVDVLTVTRADGRETVLRDVAAGRVLRPQ